MPGFIGSRLAKVNAMRLSTTVLATLTAFVVATSGCTAIEGIFKAGVWVGMLGVVALFVLIGGLAALLSK